MMESSSLRPKDVALLLLASGDLLPRQRARDQQSDLPGLEQVTVQLAPLRVNQPWSHGYCSTCGAWPVLAEQRGLEQLRYLRCGLCADSWQVDRLWCPFCANRDHSRLGYLYVEGEEHKQRVATCDACQGYVKLRSTLTPFTPLQLLVEELALLHLDLIALEKGYLPPS